MTPHKLHQFLNYEQTPESSLGKMILRNKVSVARALSIPCWYDILGHIKARRGELPVIDLNDKDAVKKVIVQCINDQMRRMKSETDELDDNEIKILDKELLKFYLGIKDKTITDIRDQAVSFLKNRSRRNTYNTKELMRTLQSPLYTDFKGWMKHLEHMTAPDRARKYLGDPLIDWNNPEQVKKIIQSELERQSNGQHVDIEKIRQEYTQFMTSESQSADEMSKLLRQGFTDGFGPRPH